MANEWVPPYEERQGVEVLVDSIWRPGEVLTQIRRDDGVWEIQVQYRPPGQTSSLIDTFAEDDVRVDTVDRSRGRP